MLTPGERLIVLMLAEIHEELDVHAVVDAALVRDAIETGNEWAIFEKHPDLKTSPRNAAAVSETREILSVFLGIEVGVAALTPTQFEELTKLSEPVGPIFSGFDANEEKHHFAAAGFFIQEFPEFESMRDRHTNSHSPALPHYRRIVEKVRSMKPHGLMTFEQLKEVFAA